MKLSTRMQVAGVLRLESLRLRDNAFAAVSLAAVLLGPACGRSSVIERAPDGSTTVGALCEVATTRPTPYGVEFRFRSRGTATVYVHKGCSGLDYGVTSCASGFREQLGPIDSCGICNCDAALCQPTTCGACYPDEGIAVGGDATPLNVTWSAYSAALGWRGDSQCLRSRVLASGKYRLAVRVYDNAEDARKEIGGWTATHDFELPAPDDIVNVPLDSTAPESCDADLLAPAPACTGNEPRDVACQMGQQVDFAWEGGLAFSRDTSSVAQPNVFTSQRTFLEQQPPQAPLACTAPLPRCSGDARVVTTSDLTRALAAPSVAAAFASPTPVFGEDDRPVDGAILIIRRPDGKSIGVGGRCRAGSSLCARPLTDDLAALPELFSRLKNQLTTKYCPAFAP